MTLHRLNKSQLSTVDLTTYTNTVSNYDTTNISISITDDNELYITNRTNDSKPFHSKTFTDTDYYTIELEIKKPQGTYAGKDFSIVIGDSSNYLEFSFQYYYLYFAINGNVFDQISAIQITEYKKIKITRNLNNWTFDYDNGTVTHSFTTNTNVLNKLCYYGFHSGDKVYVRNVKVHEEEKVRFKDIIDVVYPIGSIYMSVNATSPQTLFGGTWTQLKDRFLLGAGDSYSNGATGGEASHQLTEAEIPSDVGLLKNVTTQYSGAVLSSTTGWKYNANRELNSAYNQAHNNMPPYLVVYMWKRTA